ncbi:MAG: hypothetical protein Q9174_003609 [Haloplaca sp. 1 TL-2023]
MHIQGRRELSTLEPANATALRSPGCKKQGKDKVDNYHPRCSEECVRQKCSASEPGCQLTQNVETGGDSTNSEVSTILAQAKKAGLPKESIERAVAKGRGISLSGAPLQTFTVEAVLPQAVSTIIQCQSDNKNRTLKDLRLIVKNLGGTLGPTTHLFDRRGHILLDSEDRLEEEAVMEAVLEAGAIDMVLEDEGTTLSVSTEPNQTASVAQDIVRSLGLKLRSSEIVWVPKSETLVEAKDVDDGKQTLEEKIGEIEADSSVEAVYHNRA